MTNQKKVAIVILNWNGTELLKKYLPSVIKFSTGDNISIIVADNGSTDNSINFVKTNFPSIQIIDLKENYGFAKGYNLALKQIDADYFVILNSDVAVTNDWINPCIKRMEEDKNIAAVQPKLLNDTKKSLFEYAGATGGFIDKYGYPFCRGRILNVIEKDEGQYNHASPVFWATGACVFVRAKLFIESGGFDEDFWAHMEEIDLCWRLKNRGYSIWYEPKSTVHHLGGGTLTYDSPKKIYLNFRNNLLMLFKNLPKEKFFPILFFRMFLDGVAAIKFIVGLNFRAFFAVCKAHVFFYKNLQKFRKKRKMLLPDVTKTNHKEIYQSGIMVKFFIQNKKKYSDLEFK